jgi:hypothetical protein
MKNVTSLFALVFAMLLVTSCSYRRLAATTTPYENDDVYYQPGDTYISDYAIADDPEAIVDSLKTTDDYYDPNSSTQNNNGSNGWSNNNSYYNNCSPYYGFGYNNFNSSMYNSYGPSLVAVWDPVYGWHFSYNINYGWGYNPYWNNASCYSNPWYNPYYSSGWNSYYWWNSPYYYSNPWYYNYNNYWGSNSNNDTGSWFGQSTNGTDFVNTHRPGFSSGSSINSSYTSGTLYGNRNQLPKKPVVEVDRTSGKPTLAGANARPSSFDSGRSDGKPELNNNSGTGARANANTQVPASKGSQSNSRNNGVSGGGRDTSKPASTPSSTSRPANTSRPAPSSPAPSRGGGGGTSSPRKHEPEANNSESERNEGQQDQQTSRPAEAKKQELRKLSPRQHNRMQSRQYLPGAGPIAQHRAGQARNRNPESKNNPGLNRGQLNPPQIKLQHLLAMVHRAAPVEVKPPENLYKEENNS